MNYINLIPSIYLFEGKVVNKDTKEVIGTGNPVEIATVYDNNGADELLVFDISSNDSEHEANISAMINIADSVDIPMLVGGNIKRLEDVKKYIYTGAKKAVLNVDTDMHLLEEASSRFGSDNIALISNYNLSEDIEKKISLVITTKENIESLKDVLYISNNVEAVADNTMLRCLL
ncbi:MAG: HisA/HisF-related TIM barrel protein [Eubacterium sp.]